MPYADGLRMERGQRHDRRGRPRPQDERGRQERDEEQRVEELSERVSFGLRLCAPASGRSRGSRSLRHGRRRPSSVPRAVHLRSSTARMRTENARGPGLSASAVLPSFPLRSVRPFVDVEVHALAAHRAFVDLGDARSFPSGGRASSRARHASRSTRATCARRRSDPISASRSACATARRSARGARRSRGRAPRDRRS